MMAAPSRTNINTAEPGSASPRAEEQRWWHRPPRLVVAIPFLWLGVTVAVPLAMVFRVSLSESVRARPPYAPVFDWSGGWEALLEQIGQLGFASYLSILEDPLMAVAAWTSIRIAAISTLLALAIGFPLAHAMAGSPRRWQSLLVLFAILPFWTSFLIRVYAWIAILKPEGLLNHALLGIGIIGEPLTLLNTEGAVILGIVYSYLPFMILPLYASLEKFDRSLTEAAQDLGAAPRTAFWRVTVPNVRHGILAGAMLVFIPALGEVVVPDLLGGSETLMLGRALWNEFFANADWPLASAVGIFLLVLVLLPALLAQSAGRATEPMRGRP